MSANSRTHPLALHHAPHPLAGRTVQIKATATHFQFKVFGGSEYRVEDYWYRVTGGSWMDADGNPAALIYAMRSADNNLPMDNEVLYGKVGAFGVLLHVSEIDERVEPTDGR